MPSWFGPGDTTWAPTQLPGARSGFAYLTYDGKFWLFGGIDAVSAYSLNVFSFDTATNVWTARTELPASLDSGAPAAHVAGIAYLVDGSGFRSYNLATGTVTALTAPSTLARFHGLVAHSGLIYYGLASTFFSVYDSGLGSWSPLTVWPVLAGVSRNAAHVCGDGTYLYAQEGADFGRYDPSLDTWAVLAAPPAAHQGAWGSMAYNAATNKILLSGGYDGAALDALSEYDIAGDTWVALTAMPLGTRDEHGSAVIDGRYFVVGGLDVGTNTVDTVEAWAATAPAISPVADLEVSYDTPLVVDLEVSYDVPRFGDLEVSYATLAEVTAGLNVTYAVPSGYNAQTSLRVQYRTGRTARDHLLVTYNQIPERTTHTFVTVTVTGS